MTFIRRIRPDDWQKFKTLRTEAVRLHPEAFGATYESELAKSHEQWRQRLTATVQSPDETILVADNDCQLVGMVGVYREHGKYHHVANIWGVFVQADYRGRDLGCTLMHEALAWARKQVGLQKVKLHVNAINEPARKLYLACGFQEVGRLRRELNVDGQLYDMLLMEMFL